LTSILFITSNGTGMGHLTRCMAIARRLPGELTPIILTLSKALPPVRQQGFYAEYFPSPNLSGLRGPAWNAGFGARVSAVLREYQPAVVAFDGTYPYRGLRDAIEAHPEQTWVWIRRPMWQPAVEPKALRFSGFFDRVIEPGEFAEAADEGPTVRLREEAITVPPILFCDEDEVLSREDAEADLGLEPGRTHVLIQLGEVPQHQRDFMMQACASHILQYPGTDVVVLQSAISESLVLPPAVFRLGATYPIARLYRAFDFVMSAAGYNSYHELIGFQIPAAFFPVRKPLDNQAARARFAEEMGVGLEVGLDTTRAVETLMNAEERVRMRDRARELSFLNGASSAAEALERLAVSPSGAPSSASPGHSGEERAVSAVGPNSSREDARISLKAATAEQLGEIRGIGPATARKIIALRDRNRKLTSLEELNQVRGIGPATMEALRTRLQP
jgi:competence ComEA-like helix-hairpin-helix protein